MVKWRPNWPLGQGDKPRDIMKMEAGCGVDAILVDVLCGGAITTASELQVRRAAS